MSPTALVTGGSGWLGTRLLLALTRGLLAQTGELSAPIEGVESDFQPYIFWAYGLAFVVLFAFTAWGIAQTNRAAQRIEYLRERFREAHPGVLDEGS